MTTKVDSVEMQGASLVERIDDLLPQTQCRRCGYEACRPYAEAVAAGEADINRCPPGGDVAVQALARLLGKAPKPIDPACGEVTAAEKAIIDEQVCIGCTICIQVCPVDAVVGATGHMHTVVAAECTGCELCVDPCPVDCIRMVPAGQARRHRADVARRRYRARQERLRRERHRARRRQGRRAKRAVIEAAVARVQARRAARRRG